MAYLQLLCSISLSITSENVIYLSGEKSIVFIVSND